jgi:hypothetical protein
MNVAEETDKSVYIGASRSQEKLTGLENMCFPLSCSLPSFSFTEDDKV